MTPPTLTTMPMEPLFLLLLLVVLVLAVAARRRAQPWPRRPPGPFPWPYVGNVKELRQLSQKLGGQHEALLELSKRYASPVISLRLGSRDTIVVSGTECIHRVLDEPEYDGRPWTYFISLRNFGKRKGITMNDGPIWWLIRSWFVRSIKSVGFARREMTESIKEELEMILEDLQEGGVRQMKSIIMSGIINVLWTFAAGKRFEGDKLQHFINLMDRRAAAFDMTGGILAAYPWLRHIAPEYSGYNLLMTLSNEFKAILMETIEEHKRNYVPGSQADLIDLFLNEMYSGKGPEAGFDEDQLVVILLDILLAGLNITATTLDFLFLNMLINQESQRLVHEEIDNVIGQEKLPDFRDRTKMPYVEAVMLESQRLTPVVPIIGPRRVLRDTTLLNYDLPRESFIIMNLHSIHADPELYPEPNKFNPDRFIKNGACIKDDNLLFFGKGRRQCPGVSLAKSATFILFAGIMQRYELLPPTGQDIPTLQINAGMTMSPKPYDVLLKSRTSMMDSGVGF